MAEWRFLDLGDRSGPVAQLASRLSGRWGLVAAFALIDIGLQWFGHCFQEQPGTPTVLWPASGFVTAVFWLMGPSWWLVLGALHIAIESFSIQSHGDALSPVLVGCADVIDSAICATLATWWIKERTAIRAHQIALFALAAAVSTGVGALLGTAVSTSYLYPGMSYWPQAQLWWVGNWLGTVTVAPVIYAWTMSFWKTTPEVRLRSRLELLLFTLLLPAISWHVFTTPPFSVGSILQLPVMVFAVLTLAAFRLPPRWAATLAGMVVFLVALLAVNQIGGFAVRESFAGMIYVQTFLASVAIWTFLLATAIAEMRVTTSRLRYSEYRYRNFVELSSEAVWCVELAEPMPVTLPNGQMQEWFRTHGRISECSLSYVRVDPDGGPDCARLLREESVWRGVYQRYLEEVSRRNFSSSEFQVTVQIGGRVRTMLASFDGVVQNDCLVRIWGVARDVTELLDLNARLIREQGRLRNYARALTTAEERTRRATAVDLHDSIGQFLTGMGTTLEVVRGQVGPEPRLLLDDLRLRLREVQERTHNMISDLSPPGLYDLGLVPALNWLVVCCRSQDKLEVLLDCRVDEARIGLDLRIHVFKLVRELLRNVVRHSGVNRATVRVREDGQAVRIEVGDAGRGFEWKADASARTRSGFGLWSVAERVAEAGGQLSVNTSPGNGAQFALLLPLQSANSGDGPAPANVSHAL